MGLDLWSKSTDGWSEENMLALSITPHITGCLSVLGSAFIIYDVASDCKKWSSTYHRLLFAMGLYDFMSSLATSLSTVPMPLDPESRAYGNSSTCTIQGMFVHLNIASPLYNFMLSIYFLLTVTFRWSKDDVMRKAEIWLHGIPFVFVFTTTLVVLLQKGFNDSNLWCWINSTPKGCDNDSDIECESCPNCRTYYWWYFFFGPLWIAAFGTIVVMSMLVESVRKTEQKASRWRSSTVDLNARSEARKSIAKLGGAGADFQADKKREMYNVNLNAAESGAPDTQARKRNSMMTRIVVGQAFRYCIVFWITWLPGSTNRILQEARGYSYFWVMLLHVIFTPMQGFWNFIVYIDLRVKKIMKERRSAKAKKIENLKRQLRREPHDPSIPVVSLDEPDEDSFDESDF